MYKHILIPTDGSALSTEGVVNALNLAAPWAPRSPS